MIKINCSIKPKYNYKKIQQLEKRLPKTIEESIEDVIKNIQGYAIKLEKGHNGEGILIEMVECSTGKIKSKVYADPNKFISNGQSYLWFEYYGTGEYAEQNHIGKTKHFLESGYTEWYIPVSKVQRSLSYPIITMNNTNFYVAHGSKANHFLQDAEFETRNDNVETISKHIKNMLMEVCK